MFTATTPVGFVIAILIGLGLLIEMLMENILIPEVADLAFWQRLRVEKDELIEYDFRKPVIVVLMAILAVVLVAGLDLNFVETYAQSYGVYADVALNAGGLMGLASGLHLALRKRTESVYSLPGVLDATIETLESEGVEHGDGGDYATRVLGQ